MRVPLPFHNLCILAVIFASCTGKGKSFVPRLKDYDISKRQTLVLDKDLLEISGIFYLDENRIAAINDEEGKIFLVNSSTGEATESKFGKKRDYEDISMAGSDFYILESNGNIHRVPVGDQGTEEEFEFWRVKKIEFESMYYDARKAKLIMLSKEQRESVKGILAYAFDPSTAQFSDSPVFSIKSKDILHHLKDNNAEFKPSAAAMHPLTQKLFIVASEGKALLQCSAEGNVEMAWQLNPDQFPQPEGITFAPNGDLYISNEGVDGRATIVRFLYRPSKNK